AAPAAAPLFGHAPLHPGGRGGDGRRPDHGAPGPAPSTQVRQEQVWAVSHRQGPARSPDPDDDPLVPGAAAPPLRDRRGRGRGGRRGLHCGGRRRLHPLSAPAGRRHGPPGRGAPLVRPRGLPPDPRADRGDGRGRIATEAGGRTPRSPGGRMVSKTIPLESAAEAVPDLDGDEPVEVSVLIPVTERPEPLVALYEEYAAPIRALGVRYEFIFAAEPWFRELTQPLATLAAAGEPVRAVVVDQTTGETRLLKAAAAFCRGPVVLTLPAYRRIEASALPDLIACIHEGADLAVARRWPRRDPWINRIQNRILHRLLGRLAADRIHDVACGVRAFRREVLLEMPLYGDFSRFLPIFAQRDGYRVEELAVPQHPADARARIYGPGVYLRRVIDLLNLFFLLRFTDKPLR